MLQMAVHNLPPAQRRLAAIDVLVNEQLFLDDAGRLELIRELKDPKSEASQKLITCTSRSSPPSDERYPSGKFIWIFLLVVAGLAYWQKDILFAVYAILLAILKSIL